MFDNPSFESQVGSDVDTAHRNTRKVEDYFLDRDKVERQFRERLSKLPRWRRRLIETALDGGW